MSEFRKSTHKGKKYMVYYNNKWIHFGDNTMEHYKDSTPLKLYSHLNHNDKKRQKNYLSRAKGIKDKQGNLTYNNKNSSNYYSIKYLWT
jgi:hypothetical protein